MGSDSWMHRPGNFQEAEGPCPRPGASVHLDGPFRLALTPLERPCSKGLKSSGMLLLLRPSGGPPPVPPPTPSVLGTGWLSRGQPGPAGPWELLWDLGFQQGWAQGSHLGSLGCYDKVPQTGQLKAPEILKSRCQQGHAPIGGWRAEGPLACPSPWWLLAPWFPGSSLCLRCHRGSSICLFVFSSSKDQSLDVGFNVSLS